MFKTWYINLCYNYELPPGFPFSCIWNIKKDINIFLRLHWVLNYFLFYILIRRRNLYIGHAQRVLKKII